MEEKLGGALEQAATLQEAVTALQKACSTNFNYKAISGQQKKSKKAGGSKDAKGSDEARAGSAEQSRPEDQAQSGAIQRDAEELEEMPKFESFPALLKYMLTRPLERIEQEQFRTHMKITEARNSILTDLQQAQED